jgi:ABC-type transporter MlaC component
LKRRSNFIFKKKEGLQMQTTEAIKRRLAELEEQRKAISKEIRQLKRTIWQREHYKPSVNEKSLVRQNFGKSVKDLTPSERKKYDAMRQAETRKRKKDIL